MWDPPEPGIKPVTPALAGGFLTANHQRGPYSYVHIWIYIYIYPEVGEEYLRDYYTLLFTFCKFEILHDKGLLFNHL